MKKLSILSIVLGFVLAYAVPSYAMQLDQRLQFEPNFATSLSGDAGYRVGLNYAPHIPGELDRVFAVGAFWQWTFDGEYQGFADDTHLSQLGGEVRMQKAFLNNSLVPYIKAEASWLRFDNGVSEDKFGIGPGFGVNYWINEGFGFGSELTTIFVNNSGPIESQITTLMVGPRARF